MAYHRERKRYKPILDRAETGKLEGISMSPRGNILLSFPGKSEAQLEIILGWSNERVTHLNLIPNETLSQIIEHSKDTAHIEYWLKTKLAALFEDVTVPNWTL